MWDRTRTVGEVYTANGESKLHEGRRDWKETWNLASVTPGGDDVGLFLTSSFNLTLTSRRPYGGPGREGGKARLTGFRVCLFRQ